MLLRLTVDLADVAFGGGEHGFPVVTDPGVGVGVHNDRLLSQTPPPIVMTNSPFENNL